MLSFLPNDHSDLWSVMDHCNGLLLRDIKRGSELCVCNPATSRWTLLPRPPGADFRYHHYAGAYIAFDPAESPHFQVVLVPAVPKAPTPDHRQKKEKERRAQLWEEEGDAPFCLDWFFAVADGSAAIGEEETEADKERRAQLWEEGRDTSFCLDWFFAMADGRSRVLVEGGPLGGDGFCSRGHAGRDSQENAIGSRGTYDLWAT
jgi:hypothetical protein